MESTLKLFPVLGQFQFQDSEVTMIHYEYEGRSLRCCFYFSYCHIPAHCCNPRPRYFTAPDLVVDTALEEPRRKLVCSSVCPTVEGSRRVPQPSASFAVAGCVRRSESRQTATPKSRRNRPRQRLGNPATSNPASSNTCSGPTSSGRVPMQSVGPTTQVDSGVS